MVLGLKEGLVECATVCVKSWVLLKTVLLVHLVWGRMKNYPDFLLRKDDLDDGKKWGKDRRLRRMVDPRVECKNKKKLVQGNTLWQYGS